MYNEISVLHEFYHTNNTNHVFGVELERVALLHDEVIDAFYNPQLEHPTVIVTTSRYADWEQAWCDIFTEAEKKFPDLL